MKNKLILIALLVALLPFVSYSQENIPDGLIKEGNKVFIEGHNNGAVKHLQHRLENLGYWVVVSNKKDADFIIRVTGHHAWINVYKARVDFIDPTSGKSFYRSKNVNTWTRFTFASKRAAIKKLVRKRIKGHLHLKRSNNYPV